MTRLSYTSDLLAAAKLAAEKENDPLLVYLIDMALERASAAKPADVRKTA